MGRTPPRLAKLDTLYGENLELSLRLFNDRLRNDPDKIPTTALVNYIMTAARLDQQREKQEPPQIKAATVNILSIVDREGIPPERRREVMKQVIEMARETGEDTTPYENALKQLEQTTGGTNGSRT